MAFDFDLRNRRQMFRREMQRLIESLEAHTKALAALGAPVDEAPATPPRKKPRRERSRARSVAAAQGQLHPL